MNDSSSSIATDCCAISLDQKRSPVLIQCGHTFCYDCLVVYKSYQKHAWANRCPICRGQLKEKKRAVKRKYSTMTNASSENATSNATSTKTRRRARRQQQNQQKHQQQHQQQQQQQHQHQQQQQQLNFSFAWKRSQQ